MTDERSAQHSIEQRRESFRTLHDTGCFVLPNPWDVGGIRRLERLGFSALATSSAACAWALGKDDGEIALDEALEHIAAMSSATNLPVNADFENAFADDPDGVYANVGRALHSGAAGVSIEDRRRGGGLYGFEEAVARVAAARRAFDDAGTAAVLVARCEAYLTGDTDLRHAIRRLSAYAAAGADCVYAPGVIDLNEVRELVRAVAPSPVNVLLNRPGVTVAELASCGVRRISVGSTLARIAWSAFDTAAETLARNGAIAPVPSH